MFVGTGKIRKTSEHREARRLRAELGLPFKQIADAVGVSVATAHAWTRDIEITPEQKHRNLFGPRGPQNPEQIRVRAENWKRKNQERRRRFQDEGRAMAQREVQLHLAGCMLYWAEGAKDRNRVRLVNSDVHMVAFFRRFLSECFGVEPSDFQVTLNVYLGNGLDLLEIEDHWLNALSLPPSCLRGHSINHFPTSSSGKKRNKLPFGVCSLAVGSTRIVQHIYGAIQEYGGFDEPGWLDGPPRKSRPQAKTA